MSDNLAIYNAVRQPPKEALKEIQAGRLKGKSDINPMWRIKALTEQFGPVGVGWKYVVLKKWIEEGGNEEKAAFVDIDLYYKHEGEWSEAIPGTGGSSFVANERNGLYTSDECFKMALTDAISVSCKALGFAADVYWNSDSTKYNKPQPEVQPQGKNEPKPAPKSEPKPLISGSNPVEKAVNWSAFWVECKKLGYSQEQVHKLAKVDSLKDWDRSMLDELYRDIKAIKSDITANG